MIEALRHRYPHLVQVACFDTAFHAGCRPVATTAAHSAPLQAKGVQRYGFHGLSYAYLLEELARVAGQEAANGRVILAHLGNGASLAAVKEGRSIDTSMGFTPAAGLVMSTRTGDLDPGLVSFLARTEADDRDRSSTGWSTTSQGCLACRRSARICATCSRVKRRRPGSGSRGAVLLPGEEMGGRVRRRARRARHAGVLGGDWRTECLDSRPHLRRPGLPRHRTG